MLIKTLRRSRPTTSRPKGSKGPNDREEAYESSQGTYGGGGKHRADHATCLELGAGSSRARQISMGIAHAVYDVGRRLVRCTCMDARGLDDAALMAGARRSTMDELAEATVEADKVIVF
jgi:hypothetical protein